LGLKQLHPAPRGFKTPAWLGTAATRLAGVQASAPSPVGHGGQGWLLRWQRERRGKWPPAPFPPQPGPFSAAPLTHVPQGRAVPLFFVAWF